MCPLERVRASGPTSFDTEERVENLWYVVGFAFAGVTFVFLTIGAAWLLTHRTKGDGHKGLPYESGIDTYGDTHGRFGISFYIYALLFVAFDIEVVFIYLWALVFQDRSLDAASSQGLAKITSVGVGKADVDHERVRRSRLFDPFE